MRERSVRNRLDFFDLKYAQVGEPSVELKQWIVIAADVLRYGVTCNGVIEHPTHGYAVDAAALDTETDDAAGEHVHDHEHSMAAQQDRFASE
jgi:hypothetical protein